MVKPTIVRKFRWSHHFFQFLMVKSCEIYQFLVKFQLWRFNPLKSTQIYHFRWWNSLQFSGDAIQDEDHGGQLWEGAREYNLPQKWVNRPPRAMERMMETWNFIRKCDRVAVCPWNMEADISRSLLIEKMALLPLLQFLFPACFLCSVSRGVTSSWVEM